MMQEVLPRYFKPEQIRSGFGTDGFKEGFLLNVRRRSVHEVLTTRAGTSPNKTVKSKWPRGFCEYPFTQLNITTDGLVSKCCADLYFSDVMGNVWEDSLADIWHRRPFTEVRRSLYRGDRTSIETCNKCDFYGTQMFYTRAAALLWSLTS